MHLGCSEVGASLAPHSWLSDILNRCNPREAIITGQTAARAFSAREFLCSTRVPLCRVCTSLIILCHSAWSYPHHFWCDDLLPLNGYRETTKGGMICSLEEHKLRTDRPYLKTVF